MNGPQVFAIDDDAAMRDSLRFMFTCTGVAIQTYACAAEFLEAYIPECRGCILLDIRLPDMDGVALHRRLRELDCRLPVIVLTGHGDVSMAVEEMKLGAFDFLMKPVNRGLLLERVGEAMALDAASGRETEEIRAIKGRLASLTSREMEIVKHVALGQASKNIAVEFGISCKTVSHHRHQIMRKMAAANAADLVRQLALVGALEKWKRAGAPAGAWPLEVDSL